MKRNQVAPLAIALALCTQTPIAKAWNSTCTIYSNPSADIAHLGTPLGKCEAEDGPYTAQGRLRSADNQDEHARIFRDAIRAAGIPEEVLETQLVTVFTADEPAGSQKNPQLRSVAPVDFLQAGRVTRRAFGIDELAMLPDYSYSLWDWVSGNETCPLGGYTQLVDPITCHGFFNHMGMVNSNHFPPQAGDTYLRLHDIAKQRAKNCATVRGYLAIESVDDAESVDQTARFSEYLKECEIEALAIEAVAQHFLQDTWSSGHLWQRWGSPDLIDFPDFSSSPGFFLLKRSPEDGKARVAQVVAAAAALVHGIEPKAPFFPDALVHPFPDIQLAGEPLIAVAGDTHLHELLAKARLDAQSVRMLSCATASVADVYAALGPKPAWGSAGAPRIYTGQLQPVDLAACAGERYATNAAMFHGVGVDLPYSFGTVVRWSDLLATARFLPKAVGLLNVAVALYENLGPVGIVRLNVDMLQLEFDAQRANHQNALGTDMARIERSVGSRNVPGAMLGVQRNSFYRARQASYQDPAFSETAPWPETPAGTPEGRARAMMLARFFHRGHAADWCTRISVEDLESLRSTVVAKRSAGLDTTASCAACTEIAMRHIRRGTAASDYDQAVEPFCNYVPGSDAFIYQDSAAGAPTARSLAQQWCGCSACPSKNGQDDPTTIAIRSFSVTPSEIASDGPFNVNWSVDFLGSQFGQIQFNINDRPSLEQSGLNVPPFYSVRNFTRVFVDATQSAAPAASVHEDRTRTCQRYRQSGTQAEAVLCGTSGAGLQVAKDKPAFGILEACIACTLDPSAKACDVRTVPMVLH